MNVLPELWAHMARLLATAATLLVLTSCGPGTGGTGTGPILGAVNFSGSGFAIGAPCAEHCGSTELRLENERVELTVTCRHFVFTGPWEIEWIVLPEAFCLLAGALKQSRFVLEGLQVDAEAMRRNIDMTGGLVMSEAVMMGLGTYIGREYAHDLVYDICRDALKQQRPLLDLLCENAQIMKHVNREQLAAMCDPANYLGQSGVMVDRVLRRMAI